MCDFQNMEQFMFPRFGGDDPGCPTAYAAARLFLLFGGDEPGGIASTVMESGSARTRKEDFPLVRGQTIMICSMENDMRMGGHDFGFFSECGLTNP